MKQDLSIAMEYYNKAAEQGNQDALFYLGCCFAKGRGVKQSYQKAIEYYQKAAQNGNSEAKTKLKKIQKKTK